MRRFNRFIATLAVIGVLTGLFADSRTSAAERLSVCVTNKSGDVFTNLTVGKVLADGLLLENSAGQFKVKFAELPIGIRQKYQPQALAAAQKERDAAEANSRFVASQKNLHAELDQVRERRPLPTHNPDGILKITVPNQGWSIRIRDCGFGQLSKQSSSGQFICRGEATNGLNLSILVEKPRGSGTSADHAHGYYWSKAGRDPRIDHRSVRMERLGKFIKVTYTTTGMPHANYYFSYKGKWVDVHISNLVTAESADEIFAEFEARLTYGD